jgi:hypothetical protein
LISIKGKIHINRLNLNNHRYLPIPNLPMIFKNNMSIGKDK